MYQPKLQFLDPSLNFLSSLFGSLSAQLFSFEAALLNLLSKHSQLFYWDLVTFQLKFSNFGIERVKLFFKNKHLRG